MPKEPLGSVNAGLYTSRVILQGARESISIRDSNIMFVESESGPLNGFVTSSHCFFSLFWVTCFTGNHQVSSGD